MSIARGQLTLAYCPLDRSSRNVAATPNTVLPSILPRSLRNRAGPLLDSSSSHPRPTPATPTYVSNLCLSLRSC